MRRRPPLSVIACVCTSTCVLVLLVSCTSERGRVPLTSEGTAEASTTLKAGEVEFWEDIDIAYEGDASLAYRVELVQGGVVVATTTCNALGRARVKGAYWEVTNLGNSHTRRGIGSMSCSATLVNGGTTTVKTSLAFARKPPRVTLKRADLVVEQ